MAAINITYSNGAKRLGIQYAVGSDGKMYMQYPGSNNWTVYDTQNAAKGSATGKVIENLINGSGYTYAGDGRFTAILPETKTVDAVVGATTPTQKSVKIVNTLPKTVDVQTIPVRLDILDPLAPAGLNNALRIAALPSGNGLFTGDLGSFQARKNWVQAHKDYLNEKGAGIDWNNYRGTAEQNLTLKRLLGGFDEWNVAKQKAAVSVMSPSQKFVQTGYASGKSWQDAELLNMEGSLALYLNPTDYNRWMQLQLGRTKPAAYVAPTTPALNADASRTDIYNRATAVAPRALINPTVIAGPSMPLRAWYLKTGGKINYQKIFK